MRNPAGPFTGLLLVLLLSSCEPVSTVPSIKILDVPPAAKGGVIDLDTISGSVANARSDHRIVLYARSGIWYVQPWADQPFTTINPDSTWTSQTHLGTEYAALLVEPGFVPPSSPFDLPEVGNGVVAVTVVEGTPPFWRTWWFLIAVALALIAALFAFYRWRVHQVSKQLNVRFEARLAERTRIAQDLHDTLLQGLVSASMQLHVANDRLTDDSPAKPIVGRVMQMMGQVIEEGRDAVRGLRATSGNTDDLETAFSHIGQEFANEHLKDYRIVVEGTPRQLHPLIRDEAYRIVREALTNAFRHAKANKIEVELEYATKHLRIIVRDDGLGIDSNVLQQGRDGHWGLRGMRERAESIGARFKVWSRTQTGTEVELSIPGHIAFVSANDSRGKWFSRFRRNGKERASQERKTTE
ncbi:MAG TPA: histidine kinase [Pyrinomonadaceae bacterium]|nr:histidine kinase [Pyrinomonadaceae bacterium]